MTSPRCERELPVSGGRREIRDLVAASSCDRASVIVPTSSSARNRSSDYAATRPDHPRSLPPWPAQNSTSSPRDVRRMFDAVARRYDVTNDVLSLGQDRRWRREVIAAVDPRRGERGARPRRRHRYVEPAVRRPRRDRGAVRLLARHAARSARAGPPHLPFTAGDGTRLPFADDTFDAVTISFGLRNIVDPLAGLREMRRVTRPGGRLVVCEFSHPTFAPFRTVYMEYLMKALPAIARGVSSSPGRLRLPRRVDPGLARPAGAGRPDRRGRLAAPRVAQPLRRHRRPAPRRRADGPCRGGRRRSGAGRRGRPRAVAGRRGLRSSRRSAATTAVATSYGTTVDGTRWFFKAAYGVGPAPAPGRPSACDARAPASTPVVPLAADFRGRGATAMCSSIPGWTVTTSTIPTSPEAGRRRTPGVWTLKPISALLPLAEVLAAYDTLLDAHVAVADAGLVAVDLYRRLPDSTTSRLGRLHLVDLDLYRPPYTLELRSPVRHHDG